MKSFYFGKYVLYCKRINNTQHDQFIFHEGLQQPASAYVAAVEEIMCVAYVSVTKGSLW